MPRSLAFSFLSLLLAAYGLAPPAADARQEGKNSGWTSKTLGKHTQPMRSVVSPDGKYVAEVVTDTSVKLPPPKFMGKVFPPDAVVLRDANDKALVTIRSLNPKLQTSQVAFSPDSKTLAFAGIDGSTLIVDVPSGKISRKLSLAKNGLWGVAFVGDGSKLAVLDGADTVNTFDVKSGKKLASLAFADAAKEMNPRYFLLADDKHVYAAKGKDLRVTGHDLAKWDAKEVLPGRLVALLRSPDGKTLAVGIDQGKGFNAEKVPVDPKNPKGGFFPGFDVSYSLSVRDAETLKETKSVKLDKGGLWFNLAFVPGRSDQVVTNKDGTFTVLDLKTGKAAGTFTHAPPRNKGTFSYSLTAAAGGRLKTYCSEMVLGYDPIPPLPVMLWTPPPAGSESSSSPRDKGEK
jgi:WD40 repeat protein